MSAYVVEKKTIDRIVSYIDSKPLYSTEGQYPEIYRNFLGDCNKLGQKMLNMNNKAVDQRYNENNPVELYRHSYESPRNLMQVYKSVQCFVYQCSEGDVVKSKLYQDFVKLEHRLAAEIISNTPEYNKAVWG